MWVASNWQPDRHAVVDRRADATHGAVTLERHHVLGGSFLEELVGEFVAGQLEGDVHVAARGLSDTVLL